MFLLFCFIFPFSLLPAFGSEQILNGAFNRDATNWTVSPTPVDPPYAL